MTPENLKTKLLELHETLATSGPLDPELVQLLAVLDTDIQARLAGQSVETTTRGAAPSAPPAVTPAAAAGLTARAQELSARFAVQHPHLEPVLRELSDTLQRIGI